MGLFFSIISTQYSTVVYFSSAAPSLYCPAISSPSLSSHTEASSSALPLNAFYWSGLLVAFCVASIHKAWLDAFLPSLLEIPDILKEHQPYCATMSICLGDWDQCNNPSHAEVLHILCVFTLDAVGWDLCFLLHVPWLRCKEGPLTVNRLCAWKECNAKCIISLISQHELLIFLVS